MTRVLLLGLDGATFSVLEPAWAEGHMPRLRRLLAAGVSGVLESTIPPYTPPGWTSIFTGVNPGRHGIFGFTLGNVQRRGGLVSLDRVRAPAIWNAANAQGARVGLFNIPMTYPAPVVDGWSVSGMLTPEGGGATPEKFTWPHELGDGRLVVVRLGPRRRPGSPRPAALAQKCGRLRERWRPVPARFHPARLGTPLAVGRVG